MQLAQTNLSRRKKLQEKSEDSFSICGNMDFTQYNMCVTSAMHILNRFLDGSKE